MSRTATAPTGLSNVGRRLFRTVEIAITTSIAWVFGLATAAVLLYLASGLWTGQYPSASPLTLTQSTSLAQPWGLSFIGINGAYIAGGMAAGILIALGMSMMIAQTPRRLGLLAALAWSGLWTVDAVMHVSTTWTGAWWSAGNEILAATLALFIIFACMFHRAVRLWRVRVSV